MPFFAYPAAPAAAPRAGHARIARDLRPSAEGQLHGSAGQLAGGRAVAGQRGAAESRRSMPDFRWRGHERRQEACIEGIAGPGRVGRRQPRRRDLEAERDDCPPGEERRAARASLDDRERR